METIPMKETRTPVLLIPGPSAVGRDFLLESLVNYSDTISRLIGFSHPIKIQIVKKTTDRPSRTVDLTKQCVTEEEFTRGLEGGDIIASYVLESNGKRYGYRKDAFNINSDADLLVADASIYQVPELKRTLGSRAFVSAMIAPRYYREKNLQVRGSENPDEITKRLNLGDAHVAMAILMAQMGKQNRTVAFDDHIHYELACHFKDLALGRNVNKAVEFITAFTGSTNATRILLDVMQNPMQYVDELFIVSDRYRADGTKHISLTLFFEAGVWILRRVLC